MNVSIHEPKIIAAYWHLVLLMGIFVCQVLPDLVLHLYLHTKPGEHHVIIRHTLYYIRFLKLKLMHCLIYAYSAANEFLVLQLYDRRLLTFATFVYSTSMCKTKKWILKDRIETSHNVTKCQLWQLTQVLRCWNCTFISRRRNAT